MTEPHDVRVTVVSQEGVCGAGHRVGDSWTMGSKSPEGMCLSALLSLFPAMRVLRFGGEFPWAEDRATATVACPDAKNPVVFELRRLD